MGLDPKAMAAKLKALLQGKKAEPQVRRQTPEELAARLRARMSSPPAPLAPSAPPAPPARPPRQASLQGQIPWSKLPELQRLALVRSQYFTPQHRLRGLDLFAGAGGFTIGALQSSCPVIGVEFESRPVETGRKAGHDVLRMDVREVARHAPTGLAIDVLIGGPPCQPFSAAGKRKGRYDPREGFHLTFPAIDAWRPKRVVFENVKDFLLDDYRDFREEVLAGLRARFAHVGVWLLSAKDFGVPQDRERVFLWGSDVPLVPPAPTYGPGTGQPYATPKKALPHLLAEGFEALHAFQGGAISRSTDKPSMTVTTERNLYAVAREGFVYRVGAGGLRDERDRAVPQRQRRILYPEEISALQAFPPSFGFAGNLKEQAKQIGNAVPPPLAAAVVAAVTAGLKPRKVTSTELLDTVKGLDESFWVIEPRPWTDAALIGVTTSSPRAPGALVAVYDGALLKEAILAAYHAERASRQGLAQDQLSEAMQQQVFMQAMDYLMTDKDRSIREAPITVPTRTLADLGLPVATVLLPEKEQQAAVRAAVLDQLRAEGQRVAPRDVENAVDDWLLNRVADNDEVWEF